MTSCGIFPASLWRHVGFSQVGTSVLVLSERLLLPWRFQFETWHTWLRRRHHPPCNFRVESAQWGLPPNRGNITLLWLFCYPVLFSRSCAQVEPSHWFLRWMAKITCFRPKTVLLGVGTMGDVIWGNMPHKLPKRGVNTGSFKPKRHNLYIAISPEL